MSPAATTSYTVTYTLGICQAQATGTVTVNNPPTITVVTANSICTANNGIASAAVTGNGPYGYSWSTPGGTTDTIRNLSPGAYSVSVTDANGCSATATGTVGLSTAAIPISLVSEHNLTCNNDNTGSITVLATDSGAIGYSWSPSGSTASISGLAAGSYQVTATDQFGCTGTAQYTVSQPAPLVLTPPVHTDPSCPASSDGTASDTASGGSGSYHYSWSSTPVQTTQQATGLPAGTYIVTVTDDSSCVATAQVTLTDPAPTTYGTAVTTDTRCYGGNDGTAQVFPQGSTGYTYVWSDANHQTANPATGLAAGSYTVTVTDSKGCTTTAAATVGQPDAVTVLLTHTDLTCFQNNSGTASAQAAGGTSPYLYVWNNNDSTAQISSLSAATYTVTASDAGGCTATGTASLSQPTPVVVVRASTGTTCAASTDGTITVSGTGGSGSLTYALQDVTGNTIQSNTSGLFTGLGPNVFTVVATDANGCSASDTVSVYRAAFNVYSAIADSTSCYGPQYTDGSIHLQGFTIANGPFLYAVDSSKPQYTADFYNLAAGVHTVQVTDAHGCDTVFTIVVGEPLPAAVDILPGDSDIALGATLQLSTVFGPYATDSIKGYAWSPAEGLSCMDCAGPAVSPYSSQNTYTVTVTYNQGCLAIATIHINVAGDPPVYVPNAFTPNGDGTNDVFYVFGEGIKTMKLTVFNRWGEKVYESDNQSQGWDGTYKGVMQPPGVYVYLVDLIYLNDHTRLKQGSITLIR